MIRCYNCAPKINEGYPIRITITHKEFEELQQLCLDSGNQNLYDKLCHEEEKARNSKTHKKVKATKKATKARQDNAKQKIESSVNMLRLLNQKITVYSVAKDAKVSYNTANKYKEFIDTNAL